MKKCPLCWEQIQNQAKKCRFCWEWINKETHNNKIEHNESDEDEIKKISKKIAIIPAVLFFIIAFLVNYSKWFFEWLINWIISGIIIRYISFLLWKIIKKNELGFDRRQRILYIIWRIFWLLNIWFWIIISIVHAIKDRNIPYFSKIFHKRVYYRWIFMSIIICIWLIARIFFS